MKKKYEAFKRSLYNRSINKSELIEDLKTYCTFEEQEYILKRIPKTFDNLVYGNLFVKNISDFGKRTKGYYDTDEKEIDWLVHQFKKHYQEINFFLVKKKEFENAFLLGDYIKSTDILEDVKKLSFSYWGLENKFLLTQYDKGLEFNFKLLNSCRSKQISDPGYYFLVHFFSCKVEDDITFFNYDTALENSTNRDISSDYAEYFKFRLNPIKYDYKDFGSILWASGILPLFDKYLIFRASVIKYKFYENDLNKVNAYKKHCFDISEKIDDNLLLKMLSIDDVSLIINNNDSNIEELSIIDDFTIGNYSSVIKRSKTVLLKNANFSIIELYVKAHIHLNIPIQKISNGNCILDNVIALVYKYSLRNEKSNESLIDLLTSALSISSFDISKEIVCFIQRNIEKSKIEINHFATTSSYLFSDFYNPINYQIFDEISNQKSYLKSLSKNNSITIDFFEKLLNCDKSFLNKFKNVIPEYRIKFYRAKYLFNLKEYESCKDEIINLLPLIEVDYIKEHCINMLFDCFFNLNLFDEAINLYVETFLNNKTITSKVEAKKLATKVYKNRWKFVSIENINFPIFMYLVYDETHPKYIAYDLYMRSQKLDRPTELINENNLASKSQIFFLKNIANQKIISRKVTVFKSSNSVLLERISICQILARVDVKRVEEYNREIAEITKRITVQERIKEIDQSKIYVDENGILSSELSDVKKGFNRYRSISELLKSSNLDAKGIGFEALYDLLKGNIDADTYKKSMRKTDMQYEIFVQLYKEIRDKFLFSNQYGLDYYLSQRIRHGTIINQLRKSFKAYNLVTTKSSDNDEYINNENWNHIKSELNQKQLLNFEKRLVAFSSSIDEIINDLKDSSIQIRTEDAKTKQSGWFDYMFIPEWDDSWLYLVFSESLQHQDDFDDFVKTIFELLWKFTEINLTHIRENINSDIKEKLINELDNLELDLKKIAPVKSSNSIFRAIADCRTNVQSDVDYVVSWFNKSKNDEIDFYIDDALNTSLTIVNNINNPVELKLIQKNDEKSLIKGMYFPHFVDLIKIFLTNIHDYYKNNHLLDENANVSITHEENKFIIEFDNILAETENLDELRSKIEKIENDLSNINLKRIRGEGNTGFSKAYNILKNVFRDNDNYINFEVEKDKFKVRCYISLINLLK